MDLQALITSITFIGSLIWVGYIINQRISSIEVTLTEIKTLLQSTIVRIEHIEKTIDKLDKRVSDVEKTINWN